MRRLLDMYIEADEPLPGSEMANSQVSLAMRRCVTKLDNMALHI